MPSTQRKPSSWVWLKIVLCLLALDLLLFRVGLFWKLSPDFGAGLGAENWAALYAAAREFETRPADGRTAVMVGSSVVLMGVDEAAVNRQLQQHNVPVKFLRLSTHGSSCTDSALMVWNALGVRPWLVIYGAAARDFPKKGATESGVLRTFYDSSVELPLLPRHGAEAHLDAHVKRYWKLYRYRFFVHQAVQTVALDLLKRASVIAPAFAAGAPLGALPPEALRYFSPFRITPERWAVWARWHQTRRFSDYLEWMHGTMALAQYPSQTLANFGPLDNPHVDSLRWILSVLEHDRIRGLMLYFPENPVFRDPQARRYFDPSLSQAYADLLAREATAHGARFEDLRYMLEPDEFIDLVHANVIGERKLSARIAALIEAEWRRSTRLPAS